MNYKVASLLVLGWFLLWVTYDRQPAPDEFALLPGPPVAVRQAAPDFIDRRLGSGSGPGNFGVWRQRHRLDGRFRPNHNLHRLLDNDLLESHPEWFPLLGGQRTPLSGGKGPQPNLAAPGLAGHVAAQARAFWRGNPDNPTFSVSITDSVRFDTSAATRAVVEPIRYFRRRPDYSDLVFQFSNRVAIEVFGPQEDAAAGLRGGPGRSPSGKTDRYLTAYAYFWAENVPSFAAEGGLHPQLLPYLTSDRAQWWHPEYRENDRDLIERWGRAGTRIIGGRDYFNGQGFFIPRYYPELTVEFIRHLHRNRGRAYYAEGRPIWGFQAPLFWLAAQLLWEVDADAESLQSYFFESMYGPAAPAMRAFFDRCEEIWMNQEGHWQWLKYFRHPSQAVLFPPETGDELWSILMQAYAAVGGDPGAQYPFTAETPSVWSTHSLYRARVALTMQALDFMRVAARYYFAWKACAANPLASVEDRERFARDFEAWQIVRAELERREDIGGNSPRWSARERLLHLQPGDRVDLPPPERRAFRLLLDEVLLEGDVRGLSAWQLGRVRLNNGWTAAAQPYENFEMRRIPGAGPVGGALQVRNSNYLSLYQWVEVIPGRELQLGLQVRGRVSPGSWTGLYLAFFDEDGRQLGWDRVDEIPPGMHADWIPLAIRETVPAEAQRAFVALRVLHQPPGDWVLLAE